MKNKRNSNQLDDKKTLSLVHQLQPYVKQRVRVGEILGYFPRNMYKSNEIIDDVVADIYEKGAHKTNDHENLKRLMFDSACQKLSQLYESEEFHKNSISTKDMLEKELKDLEEEYTLDADNDPIMAEDLDDISYRQQQLIQGQLPYDEAFEGVKSFLDIHLDSQPKAASRRSLRRVYYNLSIEESNLIDLYILGKLSFYEIASILKWDVAEVKRKIKNVRDNIKNQLD